MWNDYVISDSARDDDWNWLRQRRYRLVGRMETWRHDDHSSPRSPRSRFGKFHTVFIYVFPISRRYVCVNHVLILIYLFCFWFFPIRHRMSKRTAIICGDSSTLTVQPTAISASTCSLASARRASAASVSISTVSLLFAHYNRKAAAASDGRPLAYY